MKIPIKLEELWGPTIPEYMLDKIREHNKNNIAEGRPADACILLKDPKNPANVVCIYMRGNVPHCVETETTLENFRFDPEWLK